MSLASLMAPVIRGDLYYATRPRMPAAKTDPDGAVRDLRSDDEARDWATRNHETLAWLPRGARVLDFGCGPGKLAVARPDLSIVGVEIDEADAARARERGLLVTGTLAGALGHFDALWCNNVVEHLDNPAALMARAVERVTTGGTVVIETPDFASAAARWWGDSYRLLHDPDHVSLFTAESLVRMVRSIGVTVTEVAFPYFGTQFDQGTLPGDPAGRCPPCPGNIVAVRGYKR